MAQILFTDEEFDRLVAAVSARLKPAAPQTPAEYMAPLAPPEDADGSKMNRGEWDAYVAKYGKFPRTPAAPTPPRVIPPEAPPLVLPPKFVDEQGYDHGSQAALDDYRRRVAIRDANMARNDAAPIPDATGPFPVESLTDRDKAFIYWLASFNPKYRDAWRLLLRGSAVKIAQAVGWAHVNQGAGFDPASYDGPLQKVVLDVYGKA